MKRQMMMKAFFILNCLILANCGQTSGNAPGLSSNDGGGGNTSACNPCKIFGTAATYQGDFAYFHGSIAASDNACATDANKPNDGSTYKALIMSGSRTLTNDWVLHANTAYQRVDGTAIGSTDTDGKLITTPLTNSITGTADNFWTGIKTGWVANTTANCDTWGDGTSSFMGTIGSGNSTGYTSIGGATRSCDNAYKFYCVQQ